MTAIMSEHFQIDQLTNRIGRYVMKKKAIMIVTAIAAIAIAPVLAGAGELEDLKKTHAKVIKAVNDLNVKEYVKHVHGNWISWAGWSFSPAVGAGGDDFAEAIESIFAQYDSWQSSSSNAQYRIVNGLGVVTSIETVSYKLKTGLPTVFMRREFHVYTKVKGKWQVIASDFTPLQVGMRL